jgi:hypothetical protein
VFFDRTKIQNKNPEIEVLQIGINIPRGKLGYQRSAHTIILTLQGTVPPIKDVTIVLR